MVESYVLEMAYDMLNLVTEGIFKDISKGKEVMSSREYMSEKDKVIKKFESKSKGTSSNSVYDIKFEDAVSMLKGMGYVPAKNGVSRSYGLSIDQLTLYKGLKQNDGFISVLLNRVESTSLNPKNWADQKTSIMAFNWAPKIGSI